MGRGSLEKKHQASKKSLAFETHLSKLFPCLRRQLLSVPDASRVRAVGHYLHVSQRWDAMQVDRLASGETLQQDERLPQKAPVGQPTGNPEGGPGRAGGLSARNSWRGQSGHPGHAGNQSGGGWLEQALGGCRSCPDESGGLAISISTPPPPSTPKTTQPDSPTAFGLSCFVAPE